MHTFPPVSLHKVRRGRTLRLQDGGEDDQVQACCAWGWRRREDCSHNSGMRERNVNAVLVTDTNYTALSESFCRNIRPDHRRLVSEASSHR